MSRPPSKTASSEAGPLFRRLLGPAFDALPLPIRDMHGGRSVWTAEGRADVERGRHPLARMVARLFRLPQAGTEIPVRIVFRARGGRERWTRHFDDIVFMTIHSLGTGRNAGLLVERLGPVALALAVPATCEGLTLEPRRLSVFGVPMPCVLARHIRACERVVDGRFAFDVDIGLPLIGRVVRYRGWLVPVRG
jgi:hypothetical protein